MTVLTMIIKTFFFKNIINVLLCARRTKACSFFHISWEGGLENPSCRGMGVLMGAPCAGPACPARDLGSSQATRWWIGGLLSENLWFGAGGL